MAYGPYHLVGEGGISRFPVLLLLAWVLEEEPPVWTHSKNWTLELSAQTPCQTDTEQQAIAPGPLIFSASAGLVGSSNLNRSHIDQKESKRDGKQGFARQYPRSNNMEKKRENKNAHGPGRL